MRVWRRRLPQCSAPRSVQPKKLSLVQALRLTSCQLRRNAPADMGHSRANRSFDRRSPCVSRDLATLATRRCRTVLPMPRVVFALDAARDGTLVVCTDRDVVVLDRWPCRN